MLTIRQKIVQHAEWGIVHASQIHYTQDARRDDFLRAKPHDKLPIWTDCSGFATFCYLLAGAPDPNGLGYRSVGYTGTLLTHGKQVSTPLPGDLIVYGPGTGHHVVIYLKTWHGAWIVASHGDEHGPVSELQHREKLVQPAPVHIRSYLPRA
jgi:hypothetical protein